MIVCCLDAPPFHRNLHKITLLLLWFVQSNVCRAVKQFLFGVEGAMDEAVQEIERMWDNREHPTWK